MSKETRSIDKKGFSNKFFEELDKEHDNAKAVSYTHLTLPTILRV